MLQRRAYSALFPCAKPSPLCRPPSPHTGCGCCSIVAVGVTAAVVGGSIKLLTQNTVTSCTCAIEVFRHTTLQETVGSSEFGWGILVSVILRDADPTTLFLLQFRSEYLLSSGWDLWSGGWPMDTTCEPEDGNNGRNTGWRIEKQADEEECWSSRWEGRYWRAKA